jgi:hypothetical protein
MVGGIPFTAKTYEAKKTCNGLILGLKNGCCIRLAGVYYCYTLVTRRCN